MVRRGADKSLGRPGRKPATGTEDFDVHMSYLLSLLEEHYYYLYIYIYIYNKTNIKRNILTIKQNTLGIIYNKATRCNSRSIVFINNYKYALHVSDALCVYRQEHYKL